MTKTNQILFSAFLMLFAGAISVAAQAPKPPPAYKISAIKIVPFDEASGAFAEEIKADEERSFFNDLSISLFVTIEIAGEAGSFADGRKIEVTVTEGRRVKAKKLAQIGLIGEGGKYHFPIFLESAMCDRIKITARVVGQRTASTMTRTVPFMCGE
jgi:hypothetical protein